MKILILASNPRKDLNLDREIRDLKDVVEKSRDRQEFEVEDALAVRVGDLQDLLHRHQPKIVHFCGHGSGQQGLVFEGNDGGEQWVRAEALSDLFRLFAENVGCVLLNACYSEEQADAIVNHIDYVIGMNQAIRDDAAIAFAKGFYLALGYGYSVEQAFEFGKNAIQLEISGSSKMRSAATEVARKAEVVSAIETVEIPEHQKPILKKKPTLTTSARANIVAPEQPLSQETRVAIQVEIDKSLVIETNVKRYRDRVREFLGDRKLSPLDTIRLERLQEVLRLSDAEANRILAEEQEPIQRSQDEYEAMLIRLIEAGHYPLEAMQAELQALQQELGVTDEEVAAIAPPILAAAEEDYQARLAKLAQERQQEYEQKLQRYEQEFSQAITRQYPLDSYARDGLNKFQQSLELSDGDVARIEAPLVAPKEVAYKQRLAEEQRRKEAAERQLKLERQQKIKQKLQRYEQEFSQAIAEQYPIASSTRDRLKQLQQSLGLSDKDIAKIEQPIVNSKKAADQQRLAKERLAEERLAEKRRQEEAAAQQLLEQQQAKESLDLTRDIDLTSTEMLNGIRKRIELEDGAITVTIPSRRSPGKRLRVKGKGKLSSINQQRGDLYLRIVPALMPFDFETAVVKLFDSKVNIEYRQGRAEYFVEDLGRGVTLEMVTIAGGRFRMGSPNHELERWDSEGPQHSVTVPPFYMGKFAVTQAQWQAVASLAKVKMELNPDPARFKGTKRPVERVSWHEAVEFCDRLSQKTGKQYRLPSEAEWEYACRAGTQTPFYVGETIIPELANYNEMRGQQTTEVGTFPPNALGLYDMHGNIWEWCLDHWHQNYQGAPANGTAWVTDGNSDRRLLRGGSRLDNRRSCRSANRYYYSPDNQNGNAGFRVVCVLA